jgi:hypothetical protein
MEYRIKEPYIRTIWQWKEDAVDETTKDFLPLQSKLLYDTLNSYVSLLKSENFLQALILFRSYIEYSSQFYACLLDYDFFKKYTDKEVMDEEYKKHWFKNLKPAKVLSRIRALQTEINKQIEKDKEYGIIRLQVPWNAPFDSEFRDFLYDSLSGLLMGLTVH